MTSHSRPIAFVFPGQGSQAVGMGKELAALYPVARETFDEADAALGYKLSRLCFEGPADQLKLTEITQPAILTVSVAAWRVLQSKAITPSYLAGHSLGEYSAHVVAGTLSFPDAVRTVRTRGKYMQEAVPVGVGAMAAILSLASDKVRQVCTEAAQGEACQAANLNSPEQTVISGSKAAVGGPPGGRFACADIPHPGISGDVQRGCGAGYDRRTGARCAHPAGKRSGAVGQVHARTGCARSAELRGSRTRQGALRADAPN